ncbi:LADA_0G16336g1_1 [Lachancea dasiensis]|uniref:LADA_0G16336g1_1 n=1 Tax=Lachancea dasiensis TaxID=1072105 RepID=A0A1G4JWU6_9SACH|nr:LADA_0G16336g1_1 [Lachancea dasiensis]
MGETNMPTSLRDNVASPQRPAQRFWTDPRLLSEYVQLIFNTTVVSGILYLCVRFIQLINRDVERKVQFRAAAASAVMAECKSRFAQNQCQGLLRPPWLEPQCAHWARCMNGEAPESLSVHSAVIYAETLAEILNGFLKPISLKSIGILFFGTCGVIVVSNVAFKTYRVSYTTDQRYGFTEVEQDHHSSQCIARHDDSDNDNFCRTLQNKHSLSLDN